MHASMVSEINVPGQQLNLLSEHDRRSRDFTLNSLTNAIREIIACFPVYRTYVTDGPEPLLDREHAYIRFWPWPGPSEETRRSAGWCTTLFGPCC